MRLAFNVSFISCAIALQVRINEIKLTKILMLGQDWTGFEYRASKMRNNNFLDRDIPEIAIIIHIFKPFSFYENVFCNVFISLLFWQKMKVHLTILGTCAVQRTQKLKIPHWNSEMMTHNKSQKRVIAATNNYTLAIQEYQVWIRFNWMDTIEVLLEWQNHYRWNRIRFYDLFSMYCIYNYNKYHVTYNVLFDHK